MGVNPNPFSRERAEAVARMQRRERYERALREKKEQLAADGLPWNSLESELFDHEWRVSHIPLPEPFPKKPSEWILLIFVLLIAVLPMYWAYCDAFIRGNARSLIAFSAFLIMLCFQAVSYCRLLLCAFRMQKIGAEAWLDEEANRQKTKGIHPWNASIHAPWM